MSRKDTRASRRALVPLVTMVVSVFLPAYRACGDGGPEPALSYVHDAGGAVLILPPYVGAGLLALLTLRALAMGAVDRTTRRLGLATVLLVGLLGAGTNVLGMPNDSHWGMAGFALAMCALAVAVVRHGRGLSAWRIWEHLLCAYAFSAMSSWALLMLAAGVLALDTVSYGYGAYAFVLAPVALLMLTLPRVIHRPR